jgi:hypothetical protein
MEVKGSLEDQSFYGTSVGEVVLSKDKLAKRNWQGNKTCCFCHEYETIRHLFLDCRLRQIGQ